MKKIRATSIVEVKVLRCEVVNLLHYSNDKRKHEVR